MGADAAMSQQQTERPTSDLDSFVPFRRYACLASIDPSTNRYRVSTFCWQPQLWGTGTRAR